MQPYEVRAVPTAMHATTRTLENGWDVLERAIALTVLSVFWGIILYLGLLAAIR